MSHVTFQTPDDLTILVDQDDHPADGPSTLSPRTMDTILSTGEPSPYDLQQIARSLAATLQIRTKNH